MSCCRRKAFTLNELLVLLPIILALTAVTLRVCNGTARLQGHAQRWIAENAIAGDLVRRVQQDVGLAARAGLVEADGARRLELAIADRTVAYVPTDTCLLRIETPNDGPAIQYAWPTGRIQVRFEIEEVASGPGVVWIRLAVPLPIERGSEATRELAAAAAVGRGGSP